ncbi:PepSY-associated TM helix domain-containing protein [Pedobacter arcticus]|uniref:PepSY-associated TM helix domain-containing protein n=1 Tax=Pedobacter arcticus TaxID=752140 RepID=UPI0002D5E4E0|nr:PepSY-associated TM helix domain-containing protein [Pedobacter arcticus]
MAKNIFLKINAWLHLWLGIVSGIIVIILSITGCILVFEQEIRQLTSPWLHTEKQGEQLAPSVLYKAVANALPNKEIYSIWYHGEGKTVHFSLNSDSMVYVNPYTAEIVAMVHHEDFFHFIEEGHFHLWFPEKIGEPIVGWGTFIFFFLLLSGVIMWWPKRWNKKEINNSFTVKWKARFKRLNYDLHSVLGFYSLTIALIIAVTGLIMSFSWFNNGVYWLSGGVKTERIISKSDTTKNPQLVSLQQVDKAWKKGKNEIGDYNKDQIIVSFPKKASDVIELCVDMHNGSWRYVNLDQHTLKELPSSQYKLKDEQFANWLRRNNFSLHVGAIGGLPTKILFFFISIICASLPITGFYIWWGRWKKKIRKRRKQLISNIQA